MNRDVDLAVIGSGFAGSVMAMVARRLGLSVLLLERDAHPRFAIGESASPLVGLLLEELADRYGLPGLRPLASYGRWKRERPELGCGLKRGFTFYAHQAGRRWSPRPDRSNELLVAASPSDAVADTHWLRADVDRFLMEEAVAQGVEYLDRTAVEQIEVSGSGARLRARHRGRDVRVTAGLVVDASGPRGCLSRLLDPTRDAARGPGTQALYAHFTGVAPTADLPDYARAATPPYPADAAALHHVFDGGWMWVLRFDSGLVSAGVALQDRLARELRLADGDAAWPRVLARFPSIAAQFADAAAVRPFTWLPRLSYRAPSAAGPGWARLPSAVGFADPLLSTGMPLALLGIERLAQALERRPVDAAALSAYDAVTLAEAEHTAAYLAACYAGFRRFRRFAAYSMFYFAAASYAEAARRLGRADLAGGFLGREHPAFAAATGDLGAALRAGEGTDDAYAEAVRRAIDPWNIAGLADPAKRNWYGVDPEDVVTGAPKLGLTPSDVRRQLPHWLDPT